MARRVPDLTGQRFGRLIVMHPDRPRAPNHRARWLCRCDCGATKSILHGDLMTGDTQSCGCFHRECNSRAHTKHGKYGTPEYVVWVHMIQRCEDRNHTHYARYGGRGVRVCQHWRGAFMNFLNDVGPRPSMKHTLDRFPNRDGNYEPGNVRWATWIEQANNRNRPQRKSAKSLNRI